MKYVSTRGGVESVEPEAVALQGLAPDGGLFVPKSWPHVAADSYAGLAQSSYAVAASRILRLFLGDEISDDELARLCERAYACFPGHDAAPLRELEDGLYLLELFHGPTYSFKDVALQFLGQYLGHLLARRDKRLTIIGATSGDTGSAAIHAVRDVPNVDIVMLHPKGRTSDIQRRQMTTVIDASVHNIAIEGGFDDCQRIVKQLLADDSLRARRYISAVNSINWMRIAAQSVYYARTAARLDSGSGVTFAVPSGNFGNAYAGWVAHRLGAPIGGILAVTNANDILARVFKTGEYRPGKMLETLSPAMDIQTASNFERLLFDLCDGRGADVAALAARLEQDGGYSLDPEMLRRARQFFSAATTGETDTVAEIRRVEAQYELVVDPHTAVAMAAARRLPASPEHPVVVCATAHPAKFPEAVRMATGKLPEMPEALSALADKEERCQEMAADAMAVRDYIVGSGLV